MNIKIKPYLPAISVVFGLALSFFMPNVTAYIMDFGTLDNIAVFETQSISFDLELKLSLPERVALAASPSAEMLSLATGQALNTETAKTRAIRELEKFFSEGDFEFDTSDCMAEDAAPMFIIESENPAINMIVWEFRIFDKNFNEVIATIDDETGTMLKLIYQRSRYTGNSDNTAVAETNARLSVDEMYDASQKLTDMMTEYYGVPVRLGDYQFGTNMVYYRGDMYGRGLVIPMYGVVRNNSFSINEKP